MKGWKSSVREEAEILDEFRGSCSSSSFWLAFCLVKLGWPHRKHSSNPLVSRPNTPCRRRRRSPSVAPSQPQPWRHSNPSMPIVKPSKHRYEDRSWYRREWLVRLVRGVESPATTSTSRYRTNVERWWRSRWGRHQFEGKRVDEDDHNLLDQQYPRQEAKINKHQHVSGKRLERLVEHSKSTKLLFLLLHLSTDPQSEVDWLSVYHDVGWIVIEDSWDVLAWKGIGSVRDEETSLT